MDGKMLLKCDMFINIAEFRLSHFYNVVLCTRLFYGLISLINNDNTNIYVNLN